MNRLCMFSLFIALGFFFAANYASATVGGPTYISEIAFSVKENSVYYKVHDGGGRGCRPIIHKINLTSGLDSEVKSCDSVEEEFAFGEEGTEKYRQFMAGIYENLSYLGSISLPKNDIAVRVRFLGDHIMDETDWVGWSDFSADIFQGDKKISEINFRGCLKDQPHVFEGYMVPNSDILLLLISNKGDCFEGGYIKESVHTIKSITYSDKNTVRGFKEASATEPNTGNLVVYASISENMQSDSEAASEMTVSSKENNKFLYPALLAAAGLILGFGYALGRNIKR